MTYCFRVFEIKPDEPRDDIVQPMTTHEFVVPPSLGTVISFDNGDYFEVIDVVMPEAPVPPHNGTPVGGDLRVVFIGGLRHMIDRWTLRADERGS